MSDEDAAAALRPVVVAHPDAAGATLAYITANHERVGGYVADRARRLLTAAVTDTPPTPVAPTMAGLYARERELGHLPLAAAVARLTELQPQLDELFSRASESGQLGHASIRDVKLSSAAHELVGPRSTHPDPLVRSQLALSIAAMNIRMLTGQLADDDRPFFVRRGVEAAS